MNERVLVLTHISPRDFFGEENSNIKALKSYFPKLKIVARGSKIKVFGEEEIIDEFALRFEMLVNFFRKFNKLEKEDIELILTSDQTREIAKVRNNADIIVHGVGGKLIKPENPNQKKMVESITKNDMLFAVGPAGTGKTYTAVALAVRALKEKEVKRIVLTRPAVESGENLGFLPGDLKEKLDPYMQPLYDALRDMIPFERLASYIEKGIIEIAPLAFMRGRTLDNAFVILDEAQNTTHNQMKMFLTRMGKRAKFIITGDPGQIDLPRKQISGLKEAIKTLDKVKGINIVRLNESDVIRHKLVSAIIKAYKYSEEE